jgi:nicotinate-nucleotide--dimethylbenzimidazole phosphoribosyltransferase
MLSRLGVHPILDLDMRLGEGSASAIGINLVETAFKLYTQMATFQDLI